MGSIVPVMFETCPQHTSVVFEERRGRSVSTLSLGSLLFPIPPAGVHHLMEIPRLFAKATHAVMPASWQRTDTIISESAFRFGRRELVRDRKSPVVDGPKALFIRWISNTGSRHFQENMVY